MAKTRHINTRFWDDDFIAGLDPQGKLLFLYFLSNPLTDLCGAYEITLRRVAFDTGLSPKKIAELLGCFEAAGKILFRNGWVLIRNFGKHQQGNSPNVKKGIARSLNDCPSWVKESLSKGWGSLSIENAPIPIGITYRDNSMRQPKPEPNGLRDAPPQAAAANDAKPETSKKGTRLPDKFFVTSEMREWARVKQPDVDLNIETEKFCNHFRSQPGQKGVKLDWALTWKNWILNAKVKNGTKPYTQKRTDADVLAESVEFYENYPG